MALRLIDSLALRSEPLILLLGRSAPDGMRESANMFSGPIPTRRPAGEVAAIGVLQTCRRLAQSDASDGDVSRAAAAI
jgi:hypothetical protein